VTEPDALFQRALAARAGQDMESACDAIEAAALAAPDDPKITFACAQFHYEGWRPAAELFAKAMRLAPDNPDVIRSSAIAWAAEGETERAFTLLHQTLDANPLWLDGHKTLSQLTSVHRPGSAIDGGFASAAKAQPQHLSLWLSWFHVLVTARQWDAARAVLAEGEKLLGRQKGFALGRIFLSSEAGEGDFDPDVFSPVADVTDVGLDLCKVRYYLRHGRADSAMPHAMRHIGTPAERSFWPYLSLIWRVTGDPRADWLDRPDTAIAVVDGGLDPIELAALSHILRDLHRMQAPYPEQSVRGGTQTDRQMLFHPDPLIQKFRRNVRTRVQDYCAALPPPDPSHPLLRNRPHSPDSIAFAGSWSVLLKEQGYHACHTHVLGWLSSAFYVDLPEPQIMGDAPSGWIEFGRPPPELRLSLEPYRSVEPKPGRLVLFPSTSWHGTVPFARGERLTIAFDIAIPAAG
jgi:hypothetical protein